MAGPFGDADGARSERAECFKRGSDEDGMCVGRSVGAEFDQIRLENDAFAGNGQAMFDQSAADDSDEVDPIEGCAIDGNAAARMLRDARTGESSAEASEEEMTAILVSSRGGLISLFEGVGPADVSRRKHTSRNVRQATG